MGHAASMSLYDFANGDPVNGFDPDGRLSTKNTTPNNAPIPLTAKNFLAVFLDALAKSLVGASLIGVDQHEPNNSRSQVVGQGLAILRTDLGEMYSVPVDNPRFELASTLTAAVITYGAGSELATPAKPLPMSQRLNLVYEKLDSAYPATNPMEAMQQMNRVLDTVEDAYSGVPKNPAPSLKSDGRMYPVQSDNIVVQPSGGITATSRRHVTTYGPDGSITVKVKETGQVVYQKKGGG
jgi:hypothetical protein